MAQGLEGSPVSSASVSGPVSVSDPASVSGPPTVSGPPSAPILVRFPLPVLSRHLVPTQPPAPALLRRPWLLPTPARLPPTRHLEGPLMTAPSSIVVRAPNWVGDVVLSLPALRDLRRSHPAGAARGAGAALGGRALRRGERGGRRHREPRRRGGRRAAPGALRPRRAAAELVRLGAHAVASLDPRALGIRDRRARPAADAELPRARRRSGPKPGVLLSGDARRPGARDRGPARRLARLPAGVGQQRRGAARGRGPLDRRQRRGLLRHGEALGAGALRGRRRARGAPHRGAGRDRRRRRPSARSARRSRRSSAGPHACCAARRRSPGSSAC